MTTAGNYTAFTSESSDTISDSIARIAAELASAGAQNVIVALHPDDYLTAQIAKADTAGSYLGLPMNLARQVVAAPAVTAGTILGFAPTTGALWADREGVTVVAGLSGTDFTQNLVSILAEARGATMVRDAAHVMYGPLN